MATLVEHKVLEGNDGLEGQNLREGHTFYLIGLIAIKVVGCVLHRLESSTV